MDQHKQAGVRGLARLWADQVGESPSIGAKIKAAAKSVIIVRHMAVTLFRLSQLLGGLVPPLGFAVKQLNHILTGADLAWQAEVGIGLVLHHPTGVVWGPDVRIGRNCRIQQGVTIGGRGGANDNGSPWLGDRVILGAGSRTLGAIALGDDVTVGANAVLLRDAPARSTAMGVPASIHTNAVSDAD